MDNEDFDILNERINQVCKKEEEEFVEDMTEHIVTSLNNNDFVCMGECQPEEISQGIKDAIERNKLYSLMNDRRAKVYYEKYGIHPATCRNSVCSDCHSQCCTSKSSPIGCLFRMTGSPPNDLNYDEEYLPTHKEALDMLEKHGLLKGERQEYLEASARFGRAQTGKERNETEVKGITMSQIDFCVKEALDTYIEGCSKYFDDHTDYSGIDTGVVARNATINVEKAMGIYPNIRGLD